VGLSWTVFGIGFVLGIIQLAVGFAVGRVLPVSRPSRRPAAPQPLVPAEAADEELLDIEQIRGFTRRLHRLVSNVAGDVGRHQVRIEQLTKDLSALRSEHRSGMTDFVLARMAEIVEVNRNFQIRLASAEHKLQLQAEEIRHHASAAQTDPLTGLPNRRAFDRNLEERMHRWQTRNKGFCLIMIDADNFKDLNDREGHLAGDALLRAVADLLAAETTLEDMAARIGGDEFAMILAEDDLTQAEARCARVGQAIVAARVDLEGSKTRISVSMGLAGILPGESQNDLIARADAALYAAKEAGKGRAFYHDGMQCLPVHSQSGETPAVSLSAAPLAEGDEVAIKALCDDVRSRLDEVLGSAPASAPAQPSPR